MKTWGLAALFIATQAAVAGDPIGVPVERFNLGDQAFRERKSEARARTAVDSYQEIMEKKPDDVDALWRFAMAAHFVGSRYAKSDDEKKELFSKARDSAEKCIELAPEKAACHFWAGINTALYGEAVGILKTLFSLKTIQKHLLKSAELDPGYCYGGAYRVLAVVEEKLPGILGGSNDRAIEYYEKAVQSSPDEPMNYLFLGRLLYRSQENRERAISHVLRAANQSNLSIERLESLESVAEAQELLKSWGVKVELPKSAGL